MRNKRWYTISTLMLVMFALASCGSPHQYTGQVLEPPKPATDWTLPDQDNQTFQLSAQRGKVVLLYFGYTNCPDFCPTTMGVWKQLRQELGAAAEDVRFVMISVDPERDTQPILKRYLATFDPTFIGLRPTLEQVEQLSREYGVGVVQPAAATEHRHDPTRHGSYVYAIDPQGQFRLLFRSDATAEQMAADIKQLLETS